MVRRNPHFSSLNQRYLFPEVKRRSLLFPEAISLSIGDTSEPLPSNIAQAMEKTASALQNRPGYRGYGSEAGELPLRQKIIEVFYQGAITSDEVFVSDGAKCDIGRLQLLFGSGIITALQNPTYPVYGDTGLLLNQKLVYLDCLPENGFFPASLPHADLIYICSPNNPTGSVATHAQLSQLVKWAKERGSIVIFDAAYSGFIQDSSLPRSIYEIEGADEVAIEVSSFSKLIGFTGVRLGWSVIPKKLRYHEGGGSLLNDYERIITTFFNGASCISQAGGLAALSEMHEIQKMCRFYLENARLIKEALLPKGFPVYGGENAPYLWVDFGKQDSWKLFQLLLEETGIITTPGSGFGSCGEGFLRFSAFGSREHIQNAVERIETKWPASLSPSPI